MSPLFDEVELVDPSFAECSIKNVNHSFQIITACRSLVVSAESRAEMEEWLSALRAAAPRRQTQSEPQHRGTDDPGVDDIISAEHRWYATSHARPTYCNVCRDALAGVTSHGLSCEVCKFKSHKRCAARAPPTCKWTTLASLGNDIVEDPDGTIIMPHQWIEGNLPVSAKCAICDKTCGSVLRLQDFRCLWCRWCVHAVCRPGWRARCSLGSARVSLLPPTALNGRQDDGSWAPPRPVPTVAFSPILVFVNSKSGDNQGVKFLRRFKQLLNPMQVFELGGASGGPRGALRLFRHFRPLRVLVCSGDGSVGWVLSEIDRLNMHTQCQVAVLPLGTGNDLARVLGWGATCDDGTNLLQLLERYERASTKMLDRWSIMAFERPLAPPPVPPAPPDPPDASSSQPLQGGGPSPTFLESTLETAVLYEDTILWHLQNIVQSNDNTLIVRSAKALSQTIREFIDRVTAETASTGEHNGSKEIGARCTVLLAKLALLLDALKDEFTADDSGHESTSAEQCDHQNSSTCEADTTVSSTILSSAVEPCNGHDEKGSREKTEKDELNAAQALKGRRDVSNADSTAAGDMVFGRADSVRRAMHRVLHGSDTQTSSNLLLKPISGVGESRSPSPGVSAERDLLLRLPAPRAFADGSRRSSAASDAPVPIARDNIPDVDDDLAKLLCSNVTPNAEANTATESTKIDKLNNTLEISTNFTHMNMGSCTNLHKYKDLSGSCDALSPSGSIPNLIVPSIVTEQVYNSDQMTIIDVDKPYTEDQHFHELEETLSRRSRDLDEKDLSDALSAISNEDFSLGSENNDNKSFHGLPQSDDDLNGYIGHIDSPETSDNTCPNSETIHGESMMDDISSMLGQEMLLAMMGKNGDNETFTDETTIITSDTVSEIPLDSRNPSLEKYDDCKIRFLAKRCKVKENAEEKFGFENRAFNLDASAANKTELVEPVKYCSLAQFVEGNDIARRSFKRHMRHSKKLDRKEIINRHSIVNEELEGALANDDLSINIEKTEVVKPVEASLALDFKAECTTLNFPQVSVVVEPPSPSLSEETKVKNVNSRTANVLSEFFDKKADSLSVKSVEIESNGNLNLERRLSDQNPNLLSLDPEYNKFLRCSPAATRRISCGSLFKPGENERMSTSTSSVWRGSSLGLGAAKDREADGGKRLPIINPLVRLPAWPHVSGAGGVVGQCLLANADALCAAASPLMDPDETLSEGFLERSVMNNYFGIGIDAKISLDFHNKREEHPEKCRSRARNYMWYGVLGSKEWLHKTYRHLGQRVQLECDGQRIPLPELQGIVVLNIPSFMGGTNFWGGSRADDIFLAPSFDDRILEVVAVFGSAQMAASRLINLQKHRIAQCRVVQINILGNEGVPVQVDGEAWLQPPGCIKIMHKNRVQMLGRSRALETSLKTWNEIQQQKQSALMQGDQSGSLAAPPSPALPGQLAKREATHLISLLDSANSLVKWVKISAISERNGAGGPTHCWGDTATLYARARGVSARLDALQDAEGALVRGPELRRRIAELVRDTGDLCDSVSSVIQAVPVSASLAPTTSPLDTRQAAQFVAALRAHMISVTIEDGLAYLHADMEAQKKHPHQQKVSWLRSRKSVSEVSPGAAQVRQWSQAEVCQWLQALQLEEYAEAFARNDITGRELLALARRDLRDLGVTKIGHLKRLQHAIKEIH